VLPFELLDFAFACLLVVGLFLVVSQLQTVLYDQAAVSYYDQLISLDLIQTKEGAISLSEAKIAH
jgi:hypothetical protein